MATTRRRARKKENKRRRKLPSEDELYSFMEDAVDTTAESFDNVDIRSLFRTRAQGGGIEPYARTLIGLDTTVLPAYGAPYDSSRASTKKTKVNADSGIVSSPTFQRQMRDALQNIGKEVAHLLPHDAGFAAFYEPFILGTIGQVEEELREADETLLRLQSVIHGSKKYQGIVATAVKAYTGVAEYAGNLLKLRRSSRKRKSPSQDATDEEEKPLQKVRLSGVKHCSLNKIQLALQGEMFDKYPYMILIPIMSVEQMKNWKPGEEYEVLCMVGGKGDVDDSEVHADYRELFGFCDRAEEDDIKGGVSVLRTFVKSLASSLNERTDLDDVANMIKPFDPIPKAELDALKATKEHLRTTGTVLLPRYTKAKLAKSPMAKKLLRQGIPDPFLLALKAAVNWSNYNDQKLLPGCTKPELQCKCCGEFDEWCETHRPRLPEELQATASVDDVSDLETDDL